VEIRRITVQRDLWHIVPPTSKNPSQKRAVWVFEAVRVACQPSMRPWVKNPVPPPKRKHRNVVQMFMDEWKDKRYKEMGQLIFIPWAETHSRKSQYYKLHCSIQTIFINKLTLSIRMKKFDFYKTTMSSIW
jgi:hypothetical protein